MELVCSSGEWNQRYHLKHLLSNCGPHMQLLSRLQRSPGKYGLDKSKAASFDGHGVTKPAVSSTDPFKDKVLHVWRFNMDETCASICCNSDINLRHGTSIACRTSCCRRWQPTTRELSLFSLFPDSRVVLCCQMFLFLLEHADQNDGSWRTIVWQSWKGEVDSYD